MPAAPEDVEFGMVLNILNMENSLSIDRFIARCRMCKVWRLLTAIVALALICGESTEAAGWKAGIARSVITPKTPLWMAGYGGRTAPATGALQDLFVRVVALEDARGNRGIIVATDTLGIPRSMSDDIADRVKSRFGLERSQVALHASHTHCGPVLRGALYDAYPLDAEQIQKINAYSDGLTEEIVSTIGRALADLKPATVTRGLGTADFAVNRRTNREPDVPALRAENRLFGPVDHTVPVLAIRGTDGTLRAVVFAYACHNTTLSFQQWCGDYAGFAQLDLESRHPDALALFCMGCGADQNPLPRRTVELAQSYGQRLSVAVQAVLAKPMAPVAPELKTSHKFVELRMQGLPNQEQLRLWAAGPVDNRQRWARRLLELPADQVLNSYSYPVTAWRLGEDQLWVMLGGEVVVDYALRFKGEHGEGLWVTAYVNDVMAYIPSRRVLLEGGYEGQSSMMVYGLPTERWADDVEDRVAETVTSCLEAVRSSP